MYKYIGTEQQLIENGFDNEKDEELDENIFSKTVFSKTHKGAFVPYISTGIVWLDMADRIVHLSPNPQTRFARDEFDNLSSEFIQDLIEKGLVVEE